jgi:hypothetical protein
MLVVRNVEWGRETRVLFVGFYDFTRSPEYSYLRTGDDAGGVLLRLADDACVPKFFILSVDEKKIRTDCTFTTSLRDFYVSVGHILREPKKGETVNWKFCSTGTYYTIPFSTWCTLSLVVVPVVGAFD